MSEPLAWHQLWERATHQEPAIACVGRRILLLCAIGLVVAGFTIIGVGMTVVFVPQDLTFIGLNAEQMRQLSPTLVPVIAHDRAGFGGGLTSIGLLVWFIARYGRLSRSFVEVVFLMGLCGFGAALGVHAAIGYLDLTHLAPAYLASALFLTGVGCCGVGWWRATHGQQADARVPVSTNRPARM